MSIQPYKSSEAPHSNMQRELVIDGAVFEVGIDCYDPDEHGQVTPPERYWCECVKLGGQWWGAQDALSKPMHEMLDYALIAKIKAEHAEARKP
jgi:hypothetical protein